jgi:hypothetical protein
LSTELKLSDLSSDEILKIVEPIMDNCLEGSNEGNHKKHTRDFTDRMKSIVTPKNLRNNYQATQKFILPIGNFCIFSEELIL